MNELCFEKLPPEVLLNILKCLRLRDLRNLILTSKYLKNFIINESSLWKIIYRDKVIINRTKQVPYLSWYNKCRISYNWCKGIFKHKVILQQNTNYMPWMQLFNSNILFLSIGKELACFSLDRTALSKQLLWKLSVPTVERFDVRINDISRFIVKNNMIVCGNRDGSCATFKLQEINKKPVILKYIKNCHNFGQDEVSAVEKCKNFIATASYVSSSVHLWSMNTDICENTSNENTILKKYELPECIGCRSLAISPTETFMAAGLNENYTPICMDLNTGQYLITPEPGTRTSKHIVRDIQWHDEAGIIYVTHSGNLQFIDLRTGSLTYKTRDPFQSSLFCLKSDGDKAVVVGSAEYARCVLFDLRSTHHVQMYFTQKKSTPIYSLDFDTKKLIAAGDRKVVVNNFTVNASTVNARDYSHIFKFVGVTD